MPNKDKKLRIILNSNSPWSNSGYGNQSRQFAPLIAKEGYPTAFIGFYGLEGGIIELDGIRFYPKMGSTWGDDAMIAHSKHFNADVVISLQDVWVLQLDTLRTLSQMGKRWITILPVDHDPIPPAVLERVRLAYRVISMSPFGYRELKRVGINSTYIPHTVPTQFFKKLDKSTCRKALGVPEDMFIFGMVAANKDNPPRKGFQHVLDAFKRFQDAHPNSGLYFHAHTSQPGGFQIDEYAKNLGIKNIFRSDPYKMLYDIPPEEMAKYYSVFDCLLAPSNGEGFGIPIIEAQSCQVPVITTDFTAMTDLVKDGETGFLCRVGYRRFDALGSYSGEVDDEHLYQLMEKMYVSDREKMGREARRFITDNFDLDLVWRTKWLPFLDLLEKEVHTGDNKKS